MSRQQSPLRESAIVYGANSSVKGARTSAHGLRNGTRRTLFTAEGAQYSGLKIKSGIKVGMASQTIST